MKLRREFEIATVVVFHLAFAGIGVGIGQYDPSGRIYPWPISNDRKPLFIALIVSFDEVFNSSGVVPGVNVALDLINQHDNNLLNDYSLHYILSDSQVYISIILLLALFPCKPSYTHAHTMIHAHAV